MRGVVVGAYYHMILAEDGYTLQGYLLIEESALNKVVRNFYISKELTQYS